jgi:hypothetical protein
MKKYDDEPLLVAHLLGGRYGLEKVEDEGTMQQKVAYAIQVAREIRRQLAELDAQGALRWPPQEEKKSAPPAPEQLGLATANEGKT